MSLTDNLNEENNLNALKSDFIAQLSNDNPFESLQELLNSLPSAAAILNSHRQAVFVNKYLLNRLGVGSFENLFGKKPGEILNCLHALENEDQCGISESCKLCGALQALKKTQATNDTAISEMRLTSIQRGIIMASDFKITVSPLLLNDHSYMIMYINDISNEKRRLVLERIFFHDVLNKVSSLKGMIELLTSRKNYEKKDVMISTLGLIVNDLTTELIYQRQLVAAENGELEVNIEPIDVSQLINRVVRETEQFSGPSNIKINVVLKTENIKISSDITLLNRIITNMVKNAIEASDKNDSIEISAHISEKNLIISVHNKSFITKDIQLQIFQRSFSTKGEDRGMGTYSIKLLTERYLKGKAYFKSDDINGTSFYIKIPVRFGNTN